MRNNSVVNRDNNYIHLTDRDMGAQRMAEQNQTSNLGSRKLGLGYHSVKIPCLMGRVGSSDRQRGCLPFREGLAGLALDPSPATCHVSARWPQGLCVYCEFTHGGHRAFVCIVSLHMAIKYLLCVFSLLQDEFLVLVTQEGHECP